MSWWQLLLEMVWEALNKPARAHRTAFLFNGASVRIMNMLSLAWGEGEFRHWVRVLKKMKATRIYLYLANYGDGPGGATNMANVTSFYRDNIHGGRVDRDKVDFMLDRIRWARHEAGLLMVPFFHADDSKGHGIPARDMDVNERHIQNCLHLFGHYFEEAVLGLELDDYFTAAEIAHLVAYWRRISDKPIGVHYRRHNAGRALATGAHSLYGQWPVGWSRNKLVADCRDVVAKLGGAMRFVAAEYDDSSDKGHGQALVSDGGANGYGNG